MSGKTIFVGDANLDLILSGLELNPQEDKEVFCENFSSVLGGSCTLTAAAYARLGGSCDFCGLLGDDVNGNSVRAALDEAGVGLGLLRRRADLKTGITVSLVRQAMRTQVTFPGCLAEVDETDLVLKELKRYQHIHLSGLYGTKKFLPKVTSVLKAAREANISTSLDTQWDSSEKWKYADEWLPLLSFLFVNNAEALSLARRFGGLTPRDCDWQETWTCLRALTPAPIMKLGPKGAYAEGKLYPPFELASVVDPTGAGDSFAAGFLYALIETGSTFDGAIWYAQAAGTLACSFEGGSSAAFTKERVQGILNQKKGASPF
jgi:sugar/nucleoside kinase (ribokinase family)